MVNPFSQKKIFDSVVKWFGFRTLVEHLVAKVGFTDLIGTAVASCYGNYATFGRDYVIRLASIKPESLAAWAKSIRPNDLNAESDIKTAFNNLAVAFADAVGSLMPRK